MLSAGGLDNIAGIKSLYMSLDAHDQLETDLLIDIYLELPVRRLRNDN